MAGKYLLVMLELEIRVRVFDKTSCEIDIPASGESLSLQDEQSYDQKWYNLRQGMQICAMLLTCDPACVARTDWCVTSGVLYILAHCFIMWKGTESK
jgi:hypothetical protein